MFPGCLKRAGTLSDGHRTAKEEAPLTEKGAGGGLLLGATIEEKRSKDRRRWLMCFSVFVQYNCVSCGVGRLGERLQKLQINKRANDCI